MYPLTEYSEVISKSSKMREVWNTNSISPEKKNDTQMKNLKNQNTYSNQSLANESLKSDLYQALIPLYHISKFSGLLPVKMKLIGGGIYSGTLHIITVVYGYFIGIAFIVCQVWGLWRDLRDGWKNSTRLSSPTALTVNCSDVMAVVCVVTSAIFSSPFRWKYLQKTMNILSQVDEKVGTLAVKKLQRMAIALITCPLVYLIIISVFDYLTWESSKDRKKMQFKPDKGPINYVPLYFMYFVITLFEVQYALSTFHIAERFSRLNQFIGRWLKDNEISEYFKKDLGIVNDSKHQEQLASIIASDIGYIRPRKIKTFVWKTSGNENQSLAESISVLMTLHGSLCDTTKFINSAFGVPLLVGMLGCLLHLIITPYFLYTEIKQDDYSWQQLLIQSLWVIFHIVRLLIIVQPCYMATMRSKETASLVSQLLTLKWDTSVRKQLEIFSLQLLHRPLNFSACGLFSLDRALVTSIAGAVTTYLVILVQFQNEDDCSQGAKDLKNATDIIFKNSSLVKLPRNN